MTLYEIIETIKSLAIQIPNVRFADEGSIYDIENAQGGEQVFPNIVITQQTHNGDNNNEVFNYRFVIYYVDRLRDDKRNKLEVQSVGIEELKRLIYSLSEHVDISTFDVDTFTDSFQSLCAGAYTNLAIQVPMLPDCL